MESDTLTGTIIGCAIEIHRHLGPGMLESAYEECLCYELGKSGLTVVRQKPVPIIYKDVKLEYGYRLDLLVNNSVIVEIKSVDTLLDVHEAQILTYMKFAEINLGLLINFNVKLLKDGIRRFIL